MTITIVINFVIIVIITAFITINFIIIKVIITTTFNFIIVIIIRIIESFINFKDDRVLFPC